MMMKKFIIIPAAVLLLFVFIFIFPKEVTKSLCKFVIGGWSSKVTGGKGEGSSGFA